MKNTSNLLRYTCKGKGGEYIIVGRSTGAGKSRGENIVVYQDVNSEQLFHRTIQDFKERMEVIIDA